MTEVQRGFFETYDAKRLFYQFAAPTDFRGTLVICHGHGEHSGRYEKFFPHLARQGLAVAVYDFRGQGRSQGCPAHVDSFEEYLEDLGAFHAFLRERHGVTREVTLLGHSLGGLTAIHWALRHSASIRALILSSPMLGLRVPRWLIDLNGLMNQWAPGFIYRNPVYPRYLTHDAEEVRKYKQDPLIARKISVRLVSEMISYARRIEQNASPRFECPVYVLMAGDDRVVDTARTEAFFEKVCAPGKEMTAFPGCYHEIFNERGQERVFELLEGILAKVYGGR